MSDSIRTIQLWPAGGSVTYRGDPDGPALEVREGTDWRPATADERRAVRVELLAERLADRDIYHCDSSLVGALLQHSEELPEELRDEWSTENITGEYPDPSEWTVEECREYLRDHGYPEPTRDANPWAMHTERLAMALDEFDPEFPPTDSDDELRARVLAAMNADTLDGLDEWRNAVRDNAEPAEVFEWWRVSRWLAEQLAAAGEVTLSNAYGEWWGRCTTGQALIMDGVLQKVAAAILRD